MAGIYIHIPFCKQACHYCDFHFSTSMKTKGRILDSLEREIVIQKGYLGRETISSIYFGGGTPSILEREELRRIIDIIKKNFEVNDDLEITLECNPDDLNEEKLVGLRDIGVNRLSIGIQSFRDEDLTLMNRAHNAVEASSVVRLAKNAGFNNITIDLIYGIPGLSNADWKDNLQKAIALNVGHISSYCLTIEDGTAFGHFVKKGKMTKVKDDQAAQQYQMMVDLLIEAEYEHYEVSNFAKPGYVSRHNSSYWKSKKYLGIGPSAHSFDGESRQWNVANNVQYCKAIEEGESFFKKEILDLPTRYNEYILTGLRTHWGVRLSYILETFSVDFLKSNKTYLERLIAKDNAKIKGDVFSLTEKGLLLADGIAAELFIIV